MKKGRLTVFAMAVELGTNAAGVSAAPTTGRVTITANPQQVCFTMPHPQYLNFDLLIGNGLTKDIKIKEIRAFVLRGGQAVERGIMWAQALDMIGPPRTIAAGREAALFNPLIFNGLTDASTVRFEVDFDGGEASQVVTVTPQPCVTKARLMLPIKGRVVVLDGGDLFSHHRRYDYIHPNLQAFGVFDNANRHGLDLLIADRDGRTFRGDGTRNTDFYSWGQPVRAPAAGVVTAVHDGQSDNTIIGQENLWTDRSVRKNEMSGSGNYVLIDHGGGEFSLMAHVKAGSVRVAKGARVTAGEVVAQVGNSGASIMPHVHYELRSGWGMKGIRSLPAYFHQVHVLGTGERGGRRGVALETGDIVDAR